MNDDYYGSAPVRIPKSPIAITGFSGTNYEITSRLVGAFTSLPLLNVTELIVHDSGKAGVLLALEDGLEAYREAALRALDRGLRSEPFGIVVIEARMLRIPGVAARVTSDAVLVAIRHDDEPEHDAELAAILDRAVVSVRGDGTPHSVANEIVDAIGLRDGELR